MPRGYVPSYCGSMKLIPLMLTSINRPARANAYNLALEVTPILRHGGIELRQRFEIYRYREDLPIRRKHLKNLMSEGGQNRPVCCTPIDKGIGDVLSYDHSYFFLICRIGIVTLSKSSRRISESNGPTIKIHRRLLSEVNSYTLPYSVSHQNRAKRALGPKCSILASILVENVNFAIQFRTNALSRLVGITNNLLDDSGQDSWFQSFVSCECETGRMTEDIGYLNCKSWQS